MSLRMVTRQKIYILKPKIFFGKLVWLPHSKTFNKLETLLLKAVPRSLKNGKGLRQNPLNPDQISMRRHQDKIKTLC